MRNQENTTAALRKLVPSAQWGVATDGSIVFWEDPEGNPQPTPSQIDAAIAEDRKTDLKAHVNTIRSRKAAGPFNVNGYSVDADDASIVKITGKALAVQAGLQVSAIQWRMADNVAYAVPPQDFITLAQEVSEKVEAIYVFSWQLKADIDAGLITSFDQIENAPWPM